MVAMLTTGSRKPARRRGRVIEGEVLDMVIAERRVCGACAGRDMRPRRFEETVHNYYLTFLCPDCRNSVLIESPGMAGVRTVVFLIVGLGYLAALKFYDITLGSAGVAIFSIIGVLAIWNAFCIVAPHYHCPKVGNVHFDASEITGARQPRGFDPLKGLRTLKFETYWGGFFAALAMAAALALALGLVSRLTGD